MPLLDQSSNSNRDLKGLHLKLLQHLTGIMEWEHGRVQPLQEVAVRLLTPTALGCLRHLDLADSKCIRNHSDHLKQLLLVVHVHTTTKACLLGHHTIMATQKRNRLLRRLNQELLQHLKSTKLILVCLHQIRNGESIPIHEVSMFETLRIHQHVRLLARKLIIRTFHHHHL